MQVISSVEELQVLYGAASEASLKKVTSVLTDAYRVMIEHSPFVALATVGPEGLDCSPRGDRSCVVRILDDKTLALPDWRGNNRIDSLLNIVRDPRVALMFLIPGSSSVMRVNGNAVLTADPDVLASFDIDGKHPRTVTVIEIREVYFQCARAVMRAGLWDAEAQIDPARLPSPGTMLKAAQADFDAESYDREWPGRATQSMW
ncbi:pyridoxamine 5'-phosphate oxidase family protein [Peteryoungia desertarenae]|uniref:Pyridoxamine 5'-phosphate oxidase family protein n=1 Tax=Peteryoungia desertarenae TaxID=1813451 RepID=A0ABX6QQE6_9HYPH|nr:pyridoxamine 5'-phosphate oxidase family protein [Peteryoungia desertarenae]QLF70738.1 pyridoxamine 5'-phosphate oxidase family protein [Peteryoungia desertarenae]